MNTQKAKIELFARLARLGFSYDECAALTRCEMALTRWRERECGDGSNWAIERDEATGKPFDVYHGEGKSHRYPIADREAGALKRAQAMGDYEAISSKGLSILAVDLGSNLTTGFSAFQKKIAAYFKNV